MLKDKAIWSLKMSDMSGLYPSHTEGKTGCQPLTTAKFWVVLGSLVTITDDRAMVLSTFRLNFVDLHALNTSPRSFGCGEVLSSLLSVSDWSPMGGDCL